MARAHRGHAHVSEDTHHARKMRSLGRTRAHDDRAYDRHRRKRVRHLAEAARIRAGYRWRKLSAQYLRASPLCVDELCVQQRGPHLADQVDHKVSLEENAGLAYVWSNLQSLCTKAHARKSARERRKK